MKRKAGIWMYQNGGGDKIEEKLVKELNERGIESVTGINLRNAIVEDGHIYHGNIRVDELDIFFSYNAGEQTQYQVFLYEALSRVVPTINSYEAFKLTEDKFQTAFLLNKNNILTPEFILCHRDDNDYLNVL